MEREAERRRTRASTPDFAFGRRPFEVFIILAVMLFAGGLLVMQANRVSIPDPADRKISRAGRSLDVLRIAIERFRRDAGRYPSTAEGLKALVVNPGVTNWGASHRGRGWHYVNMAPPDPWENSYHYASANGSFLLASAGPDEAINTDDDIFPGKPEESEIAGPYDYWTTNTFDPSRIPEPAQR